MARERPKRGILAPAQETIEKLEKTINEGNYYGAQQMYKSISARYVFAGRCNEALDILQSGACLQLKHEQVICGAELAGLFVETLVKGKFSYTEETLDRIRQIYNELPHAYVPQDFGEDDDLQKISEALAAAKTRVECCSSFLKSAIKWSAEFGAPKSGSPELYAMLGEYIIYESPELDMAKASIYYVRGNDPGLFASSLVYFMGKCYPGEDDVAIARAVLMYLALGNLKDANDLMDELRKQLESKQLTLPRSDLINFIVHLLRTLERDALPLFKMLRQRYKSNIIREPTFNELLDQVAEKFFGVRRRNPMDGMGMFGDIFKMMGAGL